MIYRSTRGIRVFHCYQVEGDAASGVRIGWKSLEVENFISAKVTGAPYRQRPEYNPADSRVFPEVFFAVPKTRTQTV